MLNNLTETIMYYFKVLLFFAALDASGKALAN